jgi:hypothetical protein
VLEPGINRNSGIHRKSQSEIQSPIKKSEILNDFLTIKKQFCVHSCDECIFVDNDIMGYVENGDKLRYYCELCLFPDEDFHLDMTFPSCKFRMILLITQ